MRARPKGSKFRNLADTWPHLTEPDLDEIEELARANESETYRGALLALIAGILPTFWAPPSVRFV